MSRFLSRSSRLIETFETIRDKSRFFEIFVGNQDFVEINRDFVEINRDFVKINWDFFSLDRDILDFRFLDEIYQKSSYFSIEIEKNIEKSRKITKVSTSLEKSRSRLKSMVLANLIETKSRLTFENRQDYPSRRDCYFLASRSRSRSRPRRDKSKPPTLLVRPLIKALFK